MRVHACPLGDRSAISSFRRALQVSTIAFPRRQRGWHANLRLKFNAGGGDGRGSLAEGFKSRLNLKRAAFAPASRESMKMGR